MVSIEAGPSVLQDTLKIVIANAARLFEEPTLLEQWERYPTAYALAVLAQEEYGNAFLVHWSPIMAYRGRPNWKRQREIISASSSLL